MAKKYSTQRVPREFHRFFSIYKAKNGITGNKIYENMAKEWEKTQVFLDELLKNRRGSAAFDTAFYPILLLFIICVLVVASILFVDFGSGFENYTGPGATQIQQMRSDGFDAITGFDISVIIVTVGFAVLLFLSTYFFDSAPAFMGIFLALVFIMMLVSFPIVNGVFDFLDNAGVSGAINRMPATLFIVNNWIWVVVSYVCVAIVGFGARPKGDGGVI